MAQRLVDGTTRLDAAQRIRIRKGWDQEGRRGTVLMHFGAQQIAGVDLGQDWVAVKWDDADDPDNFKRAGLEIIPAEDTRWPRPWTAAGLMIKDKNQREVVHLGGLTRKDPYEIEQLVKLIVEGVNTLAGEKPEAVPEAVIDSQWPEVPEPPIQPPVPVKDLNVLEDIPF